MPKPSSRDEVARQDLLVRWRPSTARACRSSSGMACPTCARSIGITAFLPATANSTAALAHRIRLLDVGCRRDVARRALQIVGNGPVILEAEFCTNEFGDGRRDTAELRVSERVLTAGFREERTVGDGARLRRRRSRNTRRARPSPRPSQGTSLRSNAISGNRITCGASRGDCLARQPRGRRDPTRVPTHHLHHEHLRRRLAHRCDVERRFADRYGDVLRDRAEPRARVGERQIVVDRLRNADARDRIPELRAELRNLVRGVLESPPPL